MIKTTYLHCLIQGRENYGLIVLNIINFTIKPLVNMCYVFDITYFSIS